MSSMRERTRPPLWVRAVDVASVVLLLLALVVWVTGGFVLHPGGIRVSFREEWRIFAWTTGLLLVRHAFFRHPAIHHRIASGVRKVAGTQRALALDDLLVQNPAPLPSSGTTISERPESERFGQSQLPTSTVTRRAGARSSMRQAVSVAIATRVIVLATGLASVVTFGLELKPGQFRIAQSELWNLPTRFDAGWYLAIARRGYKWDPLLAEHQRQQNVAFFPAFPIAMRVAGEIVTIPAHLAHDPNFLGSTGDARVLWGGTLVCIACFALASILLVRLAELRLGDREAGARAVLLLATYPFALFFSAPYSEGMFLLCAVATFV